VDNTSLWYVLADANAISDANLFAGQMLKVPQVTTSKNDASTFKPYNPAEATGPTSPSTPYIAPPTPPQCDGLATLVMVAIAAAVTFVTAGAATAFLGPQLGAFIGGVVGSAAGQEVGKAMGAVDHFSLRTAIGAGITNTLTAGLSQVLKGSTASLMKDAASAADWAKVAASAAGTAAAGYVGNRIAGVPDTHFSWKSIAANTVTNLITAGIGNSMGITPENINGVLTTGDIGKDLANGLIGGVVSLHVRRSFGFDDPVNYGMIAADAFGNAFGNALGNAGATQIQKWQAGREAAKGYQPSDLLKNLLDGNHPWFASSALDESSTAPGPSAESSLVMGGLMAATNAGFAHPLNQQGLESVRPELSKLLLHLDEAGKKRANGTLTQQDYQAVLSVDSVAAWGVFEKFAPEYFAGIDADSSLSVPAKYEAIHSYSTDAMTTLLELGFQDPGEAVSKVYGKYEMGLDPHWRTGAAAQEFIEAHQYYDGEGLVLTNDLAEAASALRGFLNRKEGEAVWNFSHNPVEGRPYVNAGDQPALSFDETERMAGYSLVGGVILARDKLDTLTMALNRYTNSQLDEQNTTDARFPAEFDPKQRRVETFGGAVDVLQQLKAIYDASHDLPKEALQIRVYGNDSDPTDRYFVVRESGLSAYTGSFYNTAPTLQSIQSRWYQSIFSGSSKP